MRLQTPVPDRPTPPPGDPASAADSAALRLLCDAGAALASSPEPAATLPRLAALVAGSVADLCLVDLAAPDGRLTRVAAEHRDPAQADRAGELRRFPLDPADPLDALGRVAATGEPLLLPEVADEWLEAGVPDPGARDLLRGVGLRSLVAAPLAAHGEVLGVLTLASSDPARRFGAREAALAEELGRRAALAVRHARLAAEAAEAGAAATQFMAAMSHEFRTPVYVASMFAELLIMGVPEPIPPGARKHAEHIRNAARHLEELVQQILTFSRLEAEAEVVRRERVDLAALARETAGLIEPLARQKQLGFGVDLPGPGPEAVTDPNKLRQVLFNLLGNSVKFTDDGEVRLALRTGGGHAVFEVRDTGIGIAPEHRERIFEPFWQVDRESRAGLKGVGLGLNIVRRLAHLLGAEVAVESAPGTGTVFRVLLPLRGGDPQSPAPGVGAGRR